MIVARASWIVEKWPHRVGELAQPCLDALLARHVERGAVAYLEVIQREAGKRPFAMVISLAARHASEHRLALRPCVEPIESARRRRFRTGTRIEIGHAAEIAQIVFERLHRKLILAFERGINHGAGGIGVIAIGGDVAHRGRCGLAYESGCRSWRSELNLRKRTAQGTRCYDAG